MDSTLPHLNEPTGHLNGRFMDVRYKGGEIGHISLLERMVEKGIKRHRVSRTSAINSC